MSLRTNKKTRGTVLYRKIIIFFGRKSTKEVMTFLVFLCLSACFWVLQTVYEETDGSFEVQFVIREMPGNAVFTTAIPASLKVTVHDKSIALLRYYYRHNLETLEVDFGRYADDAGNFRISGAELKALLQSNIEGTTQIGSITPALIDARFALTQGKRIPVRYEGEYSAQLQSRCSPIRLTPDSVTIYAPEAILDTLQTLSTVPQNFLDLATSVNETLPLQIPIGVKADPDKIRLEIDVEEYVEKNFRHVEILTTDVPDSIRLRLFPSSVQVSCNVNVSQYKQLKEDDFVLTVSYNDLTRGNRIQNRLPVVIGSAPQTATHITLRPDSVEYIIEENYN